MKFKKFIIYFFCFFKISFCNSNADISVIEEKFNNLILPLCPTLPKIEFTFSQEFLF